jgi:hypothetical protein
MKKSTKFAPEVRERAVRMVQEHPIFFSKDGCFLKLGSPTWGRTRDLQINSLALVSLC